MEYVNMSIVVKKSGSSSYLNNATLYASGDVIFPLASYIALFVVLIFSSVLVISRLVISAEITTKSDLVLFNTTPQRRLELLVSKQTSSAGAMNNIHTAIALGLMIAPPNYVAPTTAHVQPPTGGGKILGNGVIPHHSSSSNRINEEIETEVAATPARPKKSKW